MAGSAGAPALTGQAARNFERTLSTHVVAELIPVRKRRAQVEPDRRTASEQRYPVVIDRHRSRYPEPSEQLGDELLQLDGAFLQARHARRDYFPATEVAIAGSPESATLQE